MHHIHVAILKPPYLAAILRGDKTVESRLTTTPQPPLDRVAPGERLFLKASGGPFLATAIAGEVHFYRDLDRSKMRGLCRQYRERVGGDDDYWRSKADSRFATFIALRDVEPMDVGPSYRTINMKAWYVLEAADAPVVDVPLTAGAIRNRWVALPRVYRRFPEGEATLLMPDGRVLESRINPRRHIGGRGWGRYHRMYGTHPGDCVRFVAVADRRYRVSYTKRALPA
ncbi:MAG: ASCH domain-containing protein [Phycisphaeraceae bacterium]